MAAILALALMIVAGVRGRDLFTSVEDLTEIFLLEKRVMDALNQYVQKTEAKLDLIRRYMEAYEPVREELRSAEFASSEKERSWSESLAGKPIHVFSLIKRLTQSMVPLLDYDIKADWNDLDKALADAEYLGLSQLSNEEDLREAAGAIIRLQTVYNLNVSELAQGTVLGRHSSAALTALDCVLLGKISFSNGLYYNAVDWFRQSLILAALENNLNFNTSEVSSYLDMATTTIKSIEAQDPIIPFLKEPDHYIRITTGRTEAYKKWSNQGEDDIVLEYFNDYAALCRGERLLSDAYIATLHCYYDTRNSPYLMLMPGKVEELFHSPPILFFHDVIREREIFLLKEIAKTRLRRGTVATQEPKRGSSTEPRTAQTMALDRTEEETYFKTLNLRIGHLTGLSVDIGANSAEVLQVANYGIGGHYIFHFDIEENNYLDEELSDVEQGGATAFPRLGVSALPHKGSALVWYNMKKSGQLDLDSLHGGCPVVHGTKWVANKWIIDKKQFLRRPCGLRKEE